MADLAGRGEGEGDRVTDFAAANEAEALIGKTRNPETAAESEGEGELGKKKLPLSRRSFAFRSFADYAR